MFLPSFMGFDKAGFGVPLLLDLYPNAAAAYSVRKLRTAYTGSAIRVRRSSDNAEQDIGFSGGNLDTSALTSFCGAGNGFVTTWYDQSGNGNNATQSTAANQPQIVSSGIVILQDGNVAMDFDGNNFFQVGNNTFGNIADNISVFTVSELDTGTILYPTIVAKGYSVDGSYVLGAFDNQGKMQEWADGVNYYNSSVSDIRGSQMLISNINLTGSNGLKIYKDSSLYAQFTASTDLTGTNTYIYNIGRNAQDTNYFWNGTMQEIILYSSNQTSNRTGIEANINSYYAIY